MTVVCLKSQSPRPNVKVLSSLKVGEIDDSLFADALGLVRPIYQRLGASDKAAKGSDMVTQLKTILKTKLTKSKKKD